MTDLEKWQAINQCENGKALADLILEFSDSEGMIQGRSRKFNAKEMSQRVHDVIMNDYPANLLTREFGIRQQAIYLKTFNK
jgi:hypothetical protein